MDKVNDAPDVGYVPDDEEDHAKDGKPAAPPKKAKPEPRKSSGKIFQQQLDEQAEIIQKVVAERDEFKDKYLRNLAEIDNFRKRVKKEKEEYQKFALGEFFIDLLPVMDNLERALSTSRQETQASAPIISGVEMIHKQLVDLLKKHHVTEIAAEGKPFDPNFHQALTREEREDIDEPLVAEVYQRGYMYFDKLLRPTLAKVAVPPAKMAESGEPS